jgi:hypothetical protein
VDHRKRLSAEETLRHPWFYTGEPIDTERPDLADVIFTEKEKQTIQKDYICRLEKIKEKRFREVRNSRIITEGDFIFTEHHLDTKEDEL